MILIMVIKITFKIHIMKNNSIMELIEIIIINNDSHNNIYMDICIYFRHSFAKKTKYFFVRVLPPPITILFSTTVKPSDITTNSLSLLCLRKCFLNQNKNCIFVIKKDFCLITFCKLFSIKSWKYSSSFFRI